MTTAFEWAPFLPQSYAWALLALAGLVVVLARLRGMTDFFFRGLLFTALAVIVLNPVILSEVRKGMADKLVIVVDDSASQQIGGRQQVAEKALQHIKGKLAAMPGVEPVIIRSAGDAGGDDATNLFTLLRNNIASIPLSQVAGTVLITDGQVHDVPPALEALEKFAPFHVVLTGKKNEFDRKVTVVSAPKYGLLSDDVRVAVRVDAFGAAAEEPVTLDVAEDGMVTQSVSVLPGEVREFSFRLRHPGQNVYEFSIPAEKDELTDANNRAPVIISGVRDRLRVLLVSGSPHMGERAWRNLLKSDPSIDLVHFTILRSPTSVDVAPPREMSLIVFPVDELFEKKINDFDLIIFDHYQQYGLLQQRYFLNIAAFVKAGGAFLMAMGSDTFDDSIFATPLADILPVEPKDAADPILRRAFAPSLTPMGEKHPITGDLLRGGQKWGDWFTQAGVRKTSGETLMEGVDGAPLLMISAAGEGRVAVLASDNVWLWSKGGGPYTELMRNVAHWLMKEPELEENYIKAEVRGRVITVSERSLSETGKSVTMTKPDGTTEEITLEEKRGAWVSAKVMAAQNGIYSFSNGARKAFAVVGTALNQEFSDVHTTPDLLKPVVEETKGALLWYQDSPDFTLRSVSAGGRYGGADWMGLRRNDAYTVEQVKSDALIPSWAALLSILVLMIYAWWRESGRKLLS